jgi:hypothetical protein
MARFESAEAPFCAEAEAIQTLAAARSGLLRSARNDGCLKWQVYVHVGTLVMPGLAAFAKAPAAE